MEIFIWIVGILALIGGIVLFIVSKVRYNHDVQQVINEFRRKRSYGEEIDEEEVKKALPIHKSKKPSITLIVAGILLIILGNSFTIIPTGYTGVRTTFGQVDDTIVPKGFNLKIPFVQSIDSVNNKQQDQKFAEGDAKVWGESSEKVQVYMADVTVTYQINPEKSSWIYANVSNYEESLLQSSLVASALKDSAAALKSSEVTVRGSIEPKAKEILQDALNEKYGEGTVEVIKVVINDMNFEDSYNQAIADKNLAEMNAQKQAIENQTAIDKAEADKKVALTNADSNAQVKIKEAEAEKTANDLKETSITDKILIQQYLEKWNGELPMVTGSDGNVMLDISKLLEGVTE